MYAHLPSWPCKCGHSGKQHEHYRRGTDCGMVGCGCRRYRRRKVRRSLFAWLRAR